MLYISDSLLVKEVFDRLRVPMFFLIIRHHPISTLFPYTTLFRSHWLAVSPSMRPVASTSPTHTTTGSARRSEEHTSELQSHSDLVCRLLLEKKKHQRVAIPFDRGIIQGLLRVPTAEPTPNQSACS